MLNRVFQMGGPMMWPLLACSILLGAVLIERAWTMFARPFLTGRPRPGHALHWHRHALPFFRDVPPSLGLLGTVVGVVQSFSLIDGRLNADAVGSGLAVACLTTIYGLSIAVIATSVGYLLDWIASRDTAVKEQTK